MPLPAPSSCTSSPCTNGAYSIGTRYDSSSIWDWSPRGGRATVWDWDAPPPPARRRTGGWIDAMGIFRHRPTMAIGRRRLRGPTRGANFGWRSSGGRSCRTEEAGHRERRPRIRRSPSPRRDPLARRRARPDPDRRRRRRPDPRRRRRRRRRPGGAMVMVLLPPAAPRARPAR
jgi:hypothetical protein